MVETFTALLAAHVLADFVFQTQAMVRGKGRVSMLALHGVVVLVTAVLLTGAAHPVLLALTAAHMATDWGKSRLAPGLAAFLADQALHLATLGAVALWVPGLWDMGLWAALPDTIGPALPGAMAVLAGAVLATRAGSFAIGLLMAPWTAVIRLDGLEGGGRAIGILERGLVFALILARLPEGIGFLIAAKSVLRFGTVKEEAKLSEYVIIGTLASFGWAMLAAWGTLGLLGALPALGIPGATP